MKFHTDEHVAEAVALGLQRRGFGATTTAGVNLRGSDDLTQLTYCRREGRVMVSQDADMLRLASSGIPHAGIAYCHNQKYTAGRLISRLLELAAHVTAEEMVNRIEFL